jgi:hypothetical protein
VIVAVGLVRPIPNPPPLSAYEQQREATIALQDEYASNIGLELPARKKARKEEDLNGAKVELETSYVLAVVQSWTTESIAFHALSFDGSIGKRQWAYYHGHQCYHPRVFALNQVRCGVLFRIYLVYLGLSRATRYQG